MDANIAFLFILTQVDATPLLSHFFPCLLSGSPDFSVHPETCVHLCATEHSSYRIVFKCGRQNTGPLKVVHILVLGTCDHVMSRSKGNKAADGINVANQLFQD